MTNKERFIRCVLGQEIDRTPFIFYFGPWGTTVQKWAEEGVENPGSAWLTGFGFDPPILMLSGIVNHLYCPAYEPKVLEKKGNILIMQDHLGQIIQCVEGKEGIPHILKSPVTCLEDWERIKHERLDPDDPRRFPANWKELTEQWKTADAPIQIGAFPCGLYGTLRDLMGVEGSLIAFYDDPNLVKTVMDDLTDFWLRIFAHITRDVQVDMIHIWEDMSGKQGPLISPAFIREFMLPNYKCIRDFADAHGIPIMVVDTDGNCEELIPLFSEAGINMMLPFEVTGGSDVTVLREKYPYMAMLGGINKNEIGKGREAIDRELERIRPLLGKPGYIPALDHLIPPEVSFSDYTYFVNRLRGMILGEI